MPKLDFIKIFAIFVTTIILVFEIMPMSGSSTILTMKTNKIINGQSKQSLVNYKRLDEDHVIANIMVVSSTVYFLDDHPLWSGDKKKGNKLVHSTFRISEAVLKALDKESQRRGLSLSSFVNKTLENYVTSEMYFEELGFILVSKDFLRKTFAELNGSNVEELGRNIGLTVAREYVSYFFPQVTSDTLVNFLNIWFKRFQSYKHEFDDSNNYHYFVVNHDINMNFSISLKAMLEEMIEPVVKRAVNFRDLTPGSITFSFKSNN
jgi:hypothetical protein